LHRFFFPLQLGLAPTDCCERLFNVPFR
jgi:hypothetical protein